MLFRSSYDNLKEFANKNSINIKEQVFTANNLQTFKEIYKNITSPDYKFNNEYIEGFVIEDSSDFMVKTKSAYYDKWKYLRTKMENALKNNNFQIKEKDELDYSFMEYLKSKYENKKIDIKKINIIEERKEFEKLKLKIK